MWGLISQLTFIAAMPTAKISICLSYIRVFKADQRHKLYIIALVVYMVVAYTVLFFLSLFQCKPISAFWQRTGQSASACTNITKAYYINGVSSLAIDVLLIAIVMPPILRLNMHRRQRIAVIAVISLGWIAVAAGIVRMVRTSRLIGATNIDPVWEGYDIVIWTAMEIHIAIFCAAAPCIKPLVVRLMPRFLGSTIGKGSVDTDTNLIKRNTLPLTTATSATQHGGGYNGLLIHTSDIYLEQGLRGHSTELTDEEGMAGNTSHSMNSRGPRTSSDEWHRHGGGEAGRDNESIFEVTLDGVRKATSKNPLKETAQDEKASER